MFQSSSYLADWEECTLRAFGRHFCLLSKRIRIASLGVFAWSVHGEALLGVLAQAEARHHHLWESDKQRKGFVKEKKHKTYVKEIKF